MTTVGCVQLQSTSASSIDSTYKFKKLSQTLIEAESASVGVYQRVLRPSLFSRCDYFPSDSVYSQNLAQRCGTLPSLFKTFDRFLREPDAGYLGLPVVTTDHGLSFIDLPQTCEF
jgi:putative component of membrane protein insertase Oxa1/YidC/SpoIIIJ protein YidD